MAKKEPTPAQDEPTAPRPMRDDGLELDGWGLPRCGPARQEVLGNRVDPAIDPDGWDIVPVNNGPIEER